MSLPSILPTDSVTILWMLWEGDVHSNQRRAILQRNATSNHSYPAGKKQKTGSTERKRERKGKMTDSQWWKTSSLCEQRGTLWCTSQKTLCIKKKATAFILLSTIPFFSAEISARDCQDTRTINIASPTLKPFNTLSYKKQNLHIMFILQWQWYLQQKKKGRVCFE